MKEILKVKDWLERKKIRIITTPSGSNYFIYEAYVNEQKYKVFRSIEPLPEKINVVIQ